MLVLEEDIMTIKTQFTKLSVIAAMLLGMLTMPAMATAAEDHDHGHEVTELTLNNGEKWEIDAPLSLAMNKIRDAMNKDLDGIHANNLPQEKYNALAKEINNQIAYMIENCELEPAADAQLHIIIHDLMNGAETMQSEASAQAGAVKVVGAIENYTRYFNDPKLKPLKH